MRRFIDRVVRLQSSLRVLFAKHLVLVLVRVRGDSDRLADDDSELGLLLRFLAAEFASADPLLGRHIIGWFAGLGKCCVNRHFIRIEVLLVCADNVLNFQNVDVLTSVRAGHYCTTFRPIAGLFRLGHDGRRFGLLLAKILA